MRDKHGNEIVMRRKDWEYGIRAKGIKKRADEYAARIKDEQDQLSNISLKTNDLHAYENYLQTYLNVREAIWDEKMKKCWSNNKLRSYTFKQRFLARHVFF
jgi:hypothetical protein